MRKWLVLLILLGISASFAAPVAPDATVPVSPVMTADGGGELPPSDILADTTANIFIYVTLRQPAGPEASPIVIEAVNCVLGSEYVQIKADISMATRPPEDCQYYLVYRAQWAPFTWTDLALLEDLGRRDSLWLIDPIERWTTMVDVYRYKWHRDDGPAKTRDYFGDTVWNKAAVWTTGHNVKGVCDPAANWFYTTVAADSTPTLALSPEPSHPVGEFDQWVKVGTNIVSYPVELQDVTTGKAMGELLDPLKIRNLYEWNADGQNWSEFAKKSRRPLPPFDSLWTGDTYTMIVGKVFRADKKTGTAAESLQIWTTAVPGLVPDDADLPTHTLTKKFTPTEMPTGLNFVMIPYREYNAMMYSEAAASTAHFPLLFKDILKYLPESCAGHGTVPADPSGKIYVFDNKSKNQLIKASWSRNPITLVWSTAGNDPIYPGAPVIIEVRATCTWPAE